MIRVNNVSDFPAWHFQRSTKLVKIFGLSPYRGGYDARWVNIASTQVRVALSVGCVSDVRAYAREDASRGGRRSLGKISGYLFTRGNRPARQEILFTVIYKVINLPVLMYCNN